MGRPHRADFTFAFHHVMNRAGAKRWVFTRDEHRSNFLEILQHVVESDHIEVHAYCLMGNHYHLLLRTPRANLAQAMHRLGSMFTKRFNRIENIDGPLFRARYKSRVVGQDAYLRQLCRYIHRNPVAAGIVKQAQEYPWSSYRAYFCGESGLDWLKTSELPLYFEAPDPLRAMRTFVDADAQTEIDELSFEDLFQRGRSSSQTVAIEPDRCIVRPAIELKCDLMPISLAQITLSVGAYYGVDGASLLTGRAGFKNMPRNVSIFLARDVARMKMNELAAAFCITRTSASDVLARVRKQIKVDAGFEQELTQIKVALKAL